MKKLSHKRSRKHVNDALDFHPLKLQILERVPSVTARITAFCIISVFMVSVIWASFGRVDIITKVQGVVIPASDVIQIQASISSSISDIKVREGDYINEGDLLIALNGEKIISRLEALEFERDLQEFKAGLLERELLFISDYNFNADFDLAPEDILDKYEYNLSLMNIVNYANEFKNLELRKGDAEQRLFQSKLALDRINLQKNYLSETYAKNIQLEQSGIATTENLRRSYVELQIAQVEADLAQAEVDSSEIALSSALHSISLYQSQKMSEVSSKIASIGEQIRQLENEINSLNEDLSNTLVYSPVNGIVENIRASAIGAVVGFQDVLLEVVPVEDDMIMEILVPNSSIGQIEVGLPVSIKMDSFPYSDFGVIEGKILRIPSTAVSFEGGWSYPVEVEMSRDSLIKFGHEVVPKMTGVAEVKTGSRPIIWFFLSPIMNYLDESFRER